MIEPCLEVPARSDSAQEGRMTDLVWWDDLTADEFDGLGAADREVVLEWRHRYGLTVCQHDHEQATAREPHAKTETECAAQTAE